MLQPAPTSVPGTLRRALLGAALVCATALDASAAGPAAASLDRCQNTLRSEGVKYVQATQKAVATCLGRVSTELVRKELGDVAGAVLTCSAAFAKIGRSDGGSIADRFTAKVVDRCAPSPANPHLIADLLGTGFPTVAESLRVGLDLGEVCRGYGGDGSVDSETEWLDCVRASQDCAVQQAIASAFPRAATWLAAVAAAMPDSDARDALLSFEQALDGPDDDGLPDLQCGTRCGDGVRAGFEQCDGTDLGGVACESFGFASGTLACSASCTLDVTLCTPSLLATGQTTCWGGPAAAPTEVPCAGSGQDGDVAAGQVAAYQDNGDGTVTDLTTRLVWEKKSDDESLNDKDRRFPWAGVCLGDGTTSCATDADCAVATGTCAAADSQMPYPNGLTAFEWLAALNAAAFAGHSDWRLPNARELETLLDRGRFSPAVAPAFDHDCGEDSVGNPGCSVLACSCTVGSAFWTSTTYVSVPTQAWAVYFNDATSGIRPKIGSLEPVRAVRGG